MAKEETKKDAGAPAPESKGTAPEEIKQEAETAAQKEKTVKIRLQKTKELKEPVWVRVNNRKWLIQRGVEVEVPECVYEVLRHSEEMQEIIMAFEEANVTT